MAIGTLAVTAAPGPEGSAPAELRKITHRPLADQDDVSAATSVATIRTSTRDVRLPPEAERSITAPSGLYADLCRIVKHASRHRPNYRHRLESANAK
jgi:hypothetical protein